MALSSASSDQEVWASFDDNSNYEATGSRTEALAFRTACRYLMRRRPTVVGRGNRNVTLESLDSLYKEAGDWLDLNPDTSSSAANGGSRVRYLSMENFRG